MNRAVLHDALAGVWLAYEDPVDIIQTPHSEEILPSLRRIEERVNRERLHAVGYVSYEAAQAFDRSMIVHGDHSFPLIWFGLYGAPRPIDIMDGPYEQIPGVQWKPSISRTVYADRIHTIKERIRAGDTYQVNFTYRLRASFHGSSWELFRSLIASQQCAYGAFIETGQFTICSASPELFFSLQGTTVRSRPMKGTAPRGMTLPDDDAAIARLGASEKDRAENVMIVDMVRNDLGKIAAPGSVNVTDLCGVERYPTLLQMVSTVSARTEASVSDIFAAAFPPASITGAPKVRTMEIIASLEDSPRRIYTGSIGYIMPDRRAQFNVAIRTALIEKEIIEFGVGGGVIWASTADNELEESRVKARILSGYPGDFRLLETIRWTPEEGFFLLEHHLRRVTASGRYFDFKVDPEQIHINLHDCVRSLHGPHRIRLTITKVGAIACEPVPLPDPPIEARLRFASTPVDINTPFLYHKTTHRPMYDEARNGMKDCDDVLLWNSRGEITETSIANVVVEKNGRLVTPPVSCGLLAGTFRGSLLGQGTITEEVVSVAEAMRARSLFIINSVRGWNRAILVTDEVATQQSRGVR